MSPCLNEMELEDALAGQTAPAQVEHLRECSDCREQLAEARAIRDRLGLAFDHVHAPDDLADRIRRATVGEPAAAGGHRAPRRVGPWARRHWLPMAAAASLVLAVSLVIAYRAAAPTPADAAVRELVEIHERNLTDPHDMISNQNRSQTQAYLAGELGFTPAVDDDPGDARLRACCVSRFLGRKAGTMVLDGPAGPISVVVAQVNARQLMTARKIVQSGRTFWVCPMKGYFTVAVQDGNLIYCAVGTADPQSLVRLLDHLLSSAQTQPDH